MKFLMKKPLFNIVFLVACCIYVNLNAQTKQKPVISTAVKPPNEKTEATAPKPNVESVSLNTNGLIVLKWDKPHTESISDNGPTKVFIGFKGAAYDAGKSYLPEYIKRIKLSGSANQVSINLINASYEPLSSEEVAAIDKNKIISGDVKLSYNIIHDKHQPYAQIILLPVRKNPSTGQYEKLVSFKFDVKQNSAPSGKKVSHQSFATSSVLASGKWYKIGVTADGVYKLDYNFFKNLGYNMSSLVPKDIRIFGNGGAMLPVSNSAYRPDDLLENAIYVTGQNDSSFNVNDYVLFYGQNPHTWAYSTTDNHYHHTVNFYSDTTFYFINADGGSGKRIAAEKDSGYTPTDTVTTFDDYAYNEQDAENLIQSGNQWFGQYFDVTTSYNIPFNFPNIVNSSPVYVNT